MNLIEKYGLTRIINAIGHYTTLGGSVLHPKAIEAMSQAALFYIDMDELQEKASQIIAKYTGAEAAYITSGCAAALTLATAACMTDGDPQKIYQLPKSDGMKNEVIIHRGHRNKYDLAFRHAGANLIEIGLLGLGELLGTQEWELEKAIGPNTAAVAYVISDLVIDRSAIPLQRVVEITHNHGIPVILDAAAELPPVSNLKKFIEMGVDLVAFSGGKEIRGPNGSGFVCGKKDLIEICQAQGSPHYGIGRPMKAGKEEIFGMLAALEIYVDMDHQAELLLREKWINYVQEELTDLVGVELYKQFPDATGRPVPMLWLTIDSEKAKQSASEVVKALKSGDPSIRVIQEKNKIRISPLTLMEGDAQYIVKRLREELI